VILYETFALVKRYYKFLNLTAEERSLLMAAFVSLGLVRLGLKVLSFQGLRDLLAKFSRPVSRLQSADSASVDRVVWAVRVASPYLRAVCLPQALATQVLLARRGFSSELRIGFTRAMGGRMSAHAWVECQGRVAIGGTGNMAGYILVPLSEEMVRDGWCLFS
jgi:hypothetical protein